MTAWYEQDGGGPLPDISMGRNRIAASRDESTAWDSGPAHGPSSGSRVGDRPAAPRLRFPDDDGVFGDNYPYTSEAHAGLRRWEAAAIVAGVAVFLVACLWWWPW